MNKIKLQLTADRLQVLNSIWPFLFTQEIKTVADSVFLDQKMSLRKVLQKKFVDKEFTRGNFTMSVTFTAGYFLYKSILTTLEYNLDFSNPNGYESTVLRSLSNSIYEQLI